MNAAIEALHRVEAEVSQLLAAGLGTRRAGRDALGALADDVARLKLERLAAELRSLATVEDPAKATAAAVASLTLARKLRERLDPWPEVDLTSGTLIVVDSKGRPGRIEPSSQVPAGELSTDSTHGSSGLPSGPHPSPLPEGEGTPPLIGSAPLVPPSRHGKGDRGLGPSLVERFLSGDSLVRADAARRLAALGDQGVEALSRLAGRGTRTIRREAIAALGQVGTDAAMRGLVACLGDEDVRRELLRVMLQYGGAAIPELIGVLEREGKKRRDGARPRAAWLLYRLGADSDLCEFAEDADQEVAGFGLAARARVRGTWDELGEELSRQEGKGEITRDLFAVLRAAESGGVGPVVEALDARPTNRAAAAAKRLVGSPQEDALGEHYHTQLSRGTAKDKKRAAAVLESLAGPGLVPRLAAAHDRGEIDAVVLASILGETGGDAAVGLLLDLRGSYPEGVASALGLIGEPSTAPWLFDLVQDGSTTFIQAERALVGLGDGAVEYLERELRGGGARVLRAQRILVQMKEKKSERAARALEGTDSESVPLLLSYLGHPTLGKLAIQRLAGRGDSALDVLAEALNRGAHPARLDAIAAIAAVHTARATAMVHDFVEGIISAGAAGPDAVVAARGIELLPGIQSERTVPLVARGLGAAVPMHGVAVAASETLVKLGRDSVPAALPYLDHPVAFTRMLALRALGELAAPEAEARAIELLADPDYMVANAATIALGRIGRATGSLRAVDGLATAATSPRASYPAPQIAALGATRNPAAMPRLRGIAKTYRDRRAPVAQGVENLVAHAIGEIERDAEWARVARDGRARGESAPSAPEAGLGQRLRRLFGG